MNLTPLGIDGAWLCEPPIFPDDRGVFVEWLRSDQLAEATGRRFDVVQGNHSISRRGTVRGVHFADVPPGQAKFVHCLRGAVLDVVVDIRTGSPSYGAYRSTVLDDVDRRGLFIAEGLGHAFCALTDDASVTYLLSATYAPEREHGIDPLDPELALPWPDDLDLLLSPRDAAAPRLAAAAAAELLPSYDACLAHYRTQSAR